MGNADLDRFICHPDRAAATGDHILCNSRCRFVLDNDIHRIEFGISTRHRTLEEYRATHRIQVVVQESCQLCRTQHLPRVEPVTNFDGYEIAVRDDRRTAQLVEPRRSVSADLVPMEGLVRLGREQRVAEV